MKLVYILSTGQDMHYEREKLHSFVSSIVDEKLIKYNESVYLHDLSWQTDNEGFDLEKNGNKVLDIALDEIDKCDKYMIVLLGNKYGFTPGTDAINRILTKRGLKYKSDISETELEIAYASLLNEEYKGKVLFYFRDLDDRDMSEKEKLIYNSHNDYERKKIGTLKRTLIDRFPDKVKTYRLRFNDRNKSFDDIDNFGYMVAHDLEEIFERDIQLSFKHSYINEIIKRSKNEFRKTYDCYYPIKFNELQDFKGLDYDLNNRVSVISGIHSAGKSSFLSYLYFSLKNRNDDYFKGVPFVTNSSKYSHIGFNVFKVIIHAYEQNLSLPHKQFDRDEGYNEEVLDYLYSLEREAIEEREPFISCFIDGVTPDIIKGLYYLEILSKKKTRDPHNFEGTHYYLVFNEEHEIPSVVPFYDYSNRYGPRKLLEKDITSIVETIFNFKGVNISPNIVKQIGSKEGINSPFEVNLLCNYLCLYDYNNTLPGEHLKLLATNMQDMVEVLGDDKRRLVINFVEDIAKSIDGPMVMRLLSLLTYLNYPVNHKEVEQFFIHFGWEYSTLNVALALNLLKPIIKVNDEMFSYSFVSDEVKKYVKEFLQEHNYSLVVNQLVDYAFEGSSEDKLFLNVFKISSEKNDYTYLLETFKNVLIRMNDVDNKEEIRINIGVGINKLILEGEYVLLVRFFMGLAEMFPSKEFSFLYSALPQEYPCDAIANKYLEFYTSLENKFENKVNTGIHFIDFAFIILMTKLLLYYADRNFDNGFTLLNRNLNNIKSVRGIDAWFLDDYLSSVAHLLNKSGVHSLIEKHLGLNPLQAFILDNKSLKECNKKLYYQTVFRARIMVEIVELRIQGEIFNELTWSMLRDAMNTYKETNYEWKDMWEYATPLDYYYQVRAQFLAYKHLDFYRVNSFVSYDFVTAIDFTKKNMFIYPSLVDVINQFDHLDLDVFRFNNANNDLDFGDKHDLFYKMLKRVVIRNKGLYATTLNNSDLEKVINSMTEHLYYLSVNYDENNDSANVAKEILNIIFTYCKNTDFNIESLALSFNKIIHCFDVLQDNEENEVIMLYIEQLRNYFIGGHLVTALTSYLFNWYVRNDDMLYQTALLELEASRKEKELDERFMLYYDYFEQILRELHE